MSSAASSRAGHRPTTCMNTIRRATAGSGSRPCPPRPARRRPPGSVAKGTPCGALAAAVLGGKVHAVGGVGRHGRNTPAHEVYDPATNRWTALADVPTARDHLAVAAMDGRLYAVGGRIDGNYSRNLASNEAYDPATDRW